MQGSVPPDTYAHQGAPVFKEPASVTPISHALCSPLLPPELAEIAQPAVRPLSRKKLKQQARRAEQLQSGETLLSAMTSIVNDNTAGTTTHTSTPVHRERIAPAGDQMNPD